MWTHLADYVNGLGPSPHVYYTRDFQVLAHNSLFRAAEGLRSREINVKLKRVKKGEAVAARRRQQRQVYTATRPNYVPGMQHQPLQFIAKSPGKSMKQQNKQPSERKQRDNCVEGLLFGRASFKKFPRCRWWVSCGAAFRENFPSSTFTGIMGGVRGKQEETNFHVAYCDDRSWESLRGKSSKRIHLSHSIGGTRFRTTASSLFSNNEGNFYQRSRMTRTARPREVVMQAVLFMPIYLRNGSA